MERSKKKLGLVPKLVIAIIIGILLGLYSPSFVISILITAADLFKQFLMFIIPLMVVAFVTMGIADLSQGAGKLLAFTAAISYASTLLAGSAAYFVASNFFPTFVNQDVVSKVAAASDRAIGGYFSLTITPLLETTAAVVLAFVLGVSISTMRGKEIGDALYNVVKELSEIITKVLNRVIIPLLPMYICGTFAKMTYQGTTFAIMSVLWKVFLIVIILHLLYLVIAFTFAGTITKRNPITMMKNQIPGYLTAIGTQSSAATIPVNIKCAESNGISEEIRNFVVPLCANIHMAGSMITITCCVTATLLIYGMPHGFLTLFPFICVLGIALVASPGAPGGSIFTATPFFPIVGIPAVGDIASLLQAMYIAQDSFGTACNVSGDNAISALVESYYRKYIKKEKKN
ncbi:sodium:dicarboxylate symporter [Lacrimispora amygdalina]|uniref:Dicarboxylate/amino acid:cation symporter n=1 Tax=Lacrimispora amygdalina TaxID=253257 RepID=A0A3E2N5L2_9FIRM|nr:dicarboxylate/amino acid:cation symporter [Clostridium indicum]RFZ76254.1 dicarboxylate/amino acid:cation symporter [Clostridium indicum]